MATVLLTNSNWKSSIKENGLNCLDLFFFLLDYMKSLETTAIASGNWASIFIMFIMKLTETEVLVLKLDVFSVSH